MHCDGPQHETTHHCEPNMQQTIHRIHILFILQLFMGTGLITQVAAEQRPNVVTLYVDDLGYRDIGCYDGPVKTPVLDKLAAGGVRFTDFHSGAPTCSPSRATFLTGRQHCRTGVYSVLDERFHLLYQYSYVQIS